MRKALANSACDMRKRQRMRLASDTRRAGPTLPGRRSSNGRASGSERAAVKTSASVIASSRAQSAALMPYLSGLPFRPSRSLAVVVVFFTSRCLSGGDDADAPAAAVGCVERQRRANASFACGLVLGLPPAFARVDPSALPLQRHAPHLVGRGQPGDALAQAVEGHGAHAGPGGGLLDLAEHDVGA